MTYDLIATATFGLEAVVKRELLALGMEVTGTENGRVDFKGDARAIVRANLWLRTADRVFVKMAEFPAKEPDDLYFGVKGIAWEELIPEDGKFTVNAVTVRSALKSESVTQKTAKKAIAERLCGKYKVSMLPESGAEYTVRVSIQKDIATIMVDTSGAGLHKRGYRVSDVEAPIKETLAAALVELSFWKPGRTLVDPCTGSGTIAIEAALIGRNIAPGLSRSFASEEWGIIGSEIWKDERAKAFKAIDHDADLDIRACDIDSRACRAAEDNAEEAGVPDDIVIRRCDMKELLSGDQLPENGVIIMNPPYGERIGEEREIRKIYRTISAFLKERKDWSCFLITADRTLEKGLGRRADRKRKLYNGRIETCYYQFHGTKPGK